MLGHPDAGGLVEPGGRQVAVVADLDVAAIGQARRRDPLAGECRLRRREGDPGGVDAIMFRRVDEQRAPAAADVEETVARL
jgi:hypothetical protein